RFPACLIRARLPDPPPRRGTSQTLPGRVRRPLVRGEDAPSLSAADRAVSRVALEGGGQLVLADRLSVAVPDDVGRLDRPGADLRLRDDERLEDVLVVPAAEVRREAVHLEVLNSAPLDREADLGGLVCSVMA